MTGLTDDVGFLLSRASGLVVRATNTALAESGLRVRQYSVLVLADDAPDGLSQRDLAQGLGLDPSQVVVLVDELATAGLVERRASPTDRRTKLVAATVAGRRIRRRAERLAAGAVNEQLGRLSITEQEALKVMLQRVVAGAGQAADEVAS